MLLLSWEGAVAPRHPTPSITDPEREKDMSEIHGFWTRTSSQNIIFFGRGLGQKMGQAPGLLFTRSLDFISYTELKGQGGKCSYVQQWIHYFKGHFDKWCMLPESNCLERFFLFNLFLVHLVSCIIFFFYLFFFFSSPIFPFWILCVYPFI